jgi:hypothetical protein
MAISPKVIIMGFVVIVIGASLMTSVANIVNETTYYNTNVTGATSALTGLLILFFAIIILVGAVKYIRR